MPLHYFWLLSAEIYQHAGYFKSSCVKPCTIPMQWCILVFLKENAKYWFQGQNSLIYYRYCVADILHDRITLILISIVFVIKMLADVRE